MKTYPVEAILDGQTVEVDAIVYEGIPAIVSRMSPAGTSSMQKITHIIVLEESDYTGFPPIPGSLVKLRFQLTKELIDYHGPSGVVDGHRIVDISQEPEPIYLLKK